VTDLGGATESDDPDKGEGPVHVDRAFCWYTPRDSNPEPTDLIEGVLTSSQEVPLVHVERV
jgi:hypothetical protein